MKQPPNHKLGQLQIIDDADPAWDRDRIEREIADLDGDELREHPFMAYQLGLTHFDLDAYGIVYQPDGERLAVPLREYLKPEVVPRVFRARRVGPLEVAACMDRGDNIGAVSAFSMSVRSIEGGEGNLVFQVAGTKIATNGQMQAVVDALGYEVVVRVGRNVLSASRAPTPAEGKRSGSPRGQ